LTRFRWCLEAGRREGRTIATGERLRLAEVERRVCDIASEQLGIPRPRVSPGDRIVEDLRCDSLDLVELFMEVEEAFGVTLPDESRNPVFKAVFTRQGFRLADLAELVYLVQGTGAPDREGGGGRDGRRRRCPASRLPNWTVGGIVRRSTVGPSLSRWGPQGRYPNIAGNPTACGACWSPRRPSRSGATRPTTPSTSGPGTWSRSTHS